MEVDKCVVMVLFVQAQCLHILYANSAHNMCVPVPVCVREDSPLHWLHNFSQGGNEGAVRALGTVLEYSCASLKKKESIGLYSRILFSVMIYMKRIKATV